MGVSQSRALMCLDKINEPSAKIKPEMIQIQSVGLREKWRNFVVYEQTN